MDGQKSLGDILGNNPPPASGEELSGGDPGVTGVPPAPNPAPPPVDPDANRNAGLIAALQAERLGRQRAEQIAAQALAQSGRGNTPPAAPPAQAPQQPRRDQYASDMEFQVDYMAWLARETVSETFQQHQRENERRQEQTRLQQAHSNRVSELENTATQARMAGLQKYPDYDATVNTGLAPFLQLSPDLHEGLLDLKESTFEVAYYLGKNPAEAARIAQLGSSRAIDRQLGILEDKLKKATPSPAPALPPLSGGGVPGAVPPPPLPVTLTNSRGANGQFQSGASAAWTGPKPLSEILKWKP
jgi:hypothetical protein